MYLLITFWVFGTRSLGMPWLQESLGGDGTDATVASDAKHLEPFSATPESERFGAQRTYKTHAPGDLQVFRWYTTYGIYICI